MNLPPEVTSEIPIPHDVALDYVAAGKVDQVTNPSKTSRVGVEMINPTEQEIDEFPELPNFDEPRERLTFLGNVKKIIKNHAMFLTVILSLYIAVAVFSIATVPLYVTILRILTAVVGILGIRFKNKPLFLILFSGMLIQNLIITPIACLYTIIPIFFNDWGAGSKFFVIVLVLGLVVSTFCLEACGFIKSLKLNKVRKNSCKRILTVDEEETENYIRKRMDEIENSNPVYEEGTETVNHDNENEYEISNMVEENHEIENEIPEPAVVYDNVKEERNIIDEETTDDDGDDKNYTIRED